MATETIRISGFVHAPPAAVWAAWVSPEQHAAFTGGAAEGEGRVGGAFTAFDGYICGVHRELVEGRRIVQSWRTTEFPDESPDSLLAIRFAPEKGGTRVTLVHSEIPEGQGRDYRQGWKDYYLQPLEAWFAEKKRAAKKPAKPAAKRAAKKKGAPARKAKAPAKKKAGR